MSLARRLLPPLASGLLFGAGLTLSGMTDPARVRGFLDIFGDWDPTRAVIVMAIAWRIQARMDVPIFGAKFSLPDRADLDGKLIAGAVLFGIGWGVAGLCPGPAIASLVLAPAAVLPFVGAMLAGMFVQKLVFDRTVTQP